jgi:hypothetical protein
MAHVAQFKLQGTAMPEIFTYPGGTYDRQDEFNNTNELSQV